MSEGRLYLNAWTMCEDLQSARTVSHASVAFRADSSRVSSLEALPRPPPIRQRPEDLRCPGQRWMVRRLRSTPGADAVSDVDPVAEREDVRSPSCGLLHALWERERRSRSCRTSRASAFLVIPGELEVVALAGHTARCQPSETTSPSAARFAAGPPLPSSRISL